jgi:tripartite-type tricarboxylate transporter receptor subunit TctC
MIVPFPPGGVADITARPVAEAMGRFLKQTVVVENKAGAGGGVGMQYVARAKPDGYTVLLALSSISIIPRPTRCLGRDPMYQLTSWCRSRASPPIPRCSRCAPTDPTSR